MYLSEVILPAFGFLRSLKSRQGWTFLALAWLALAAGAGLLIDRHFHQSAHELISNWALAESVAIQEGQLLSSLAKNNRYLLSSKFVSGIRLVDVESQRISPAVLAEFGEWSDVKHSFVPQLDRDLVTARKGLFTYFG